MSKYILLTVLAFLFSSCTPAFAGFDEGKKAYDSKDWTGAITELRPLAEAGDDRAMILLGNMYSEGLGVILSYPEALSLYKRAAVEKNNPEAMLAVAGIYTGGLGVDKSVNTARQWFERAARLGDPQAAFFLATILYQGNNSPTDDVQPDFYNSYKWYKIVANGAPSTFQPIAGNLAGRIGSQKMTAAEIAKADKEVADWKPNNILSLGSAPTETIAAPLSLPESSESPPSPE